MNQENNFPKIFNKSKTHFIELHRDIELAYIFESKGNKLIQILSINEIKEYLEALK